MLVNAMVPALAIGNTQAQESFSKATAYLSALEKRQGSLPHWGYMALKLSGRAMEETSIHKAIAEQAAYTRESGETNDYVNLVFLLLAAGKDPGNFEGDDLFQRLCQSQLPSGKFPDNLVEGGSRLNNTHMWVSVLLAAHGQPWAAESRKKALGYLIAQQHADGSFNWDVQNRETADVDSTGMALIALGALGERVGSPVVDKALAYLAGAQQKSGGFQSWGVENPESTFMVISGLLAVGADPADKPWQKKGGLLEALQSFQLPDGAFAHLQGGGANTLATAQGALGLYSLATSQPFFRGLSQERNNQESLSPSILALVDEVRFQPGEATYGVSRQGSTLKEPMDVAPLVQEGRIFVPVRYMAKALGIRDNGIRWDQQTQRVSLEHEQQQVQLVLGEKYNLVNGQKRKMDVEPVLQQGRIFLPARFVAEGFGYRVSWDEREQAVIIRP